jgi:hypothetical protein
MNEKLKEAINTIGDYCESRRKDCKDCVFYDNKSKDFRKCKLKIIPMDWWQEVSWEEPE